MSIIPLRLTLQTLHGERPVPALMTVVLTVVLLLISRVSRPRRRIVDVFGLTLASSGFGRWVSINYRWPTRMRPAYFGLDLPMVLLRLSLPRFSTLCCF